ncbi:FAD-dependent oxidoreductase [Mucilaginibacter conchicola]|uniref:FAD-dependent oxidoreductase n=1 Tax=Mucilaginibacter conchicola TaxID=2303333 RepID=A0A372NTS4_9SPHI|nr:FAD-dependent oxidoreductase [Mucilaginibacter conchicola]RFZ92668.1 FAD-dependent oxidoreductase [Mucilaginibacter conchicola]
MIKKLLLIVLCLGFTTAYAETIKTDVLVIGGGASGVSAAIQSARSKVKTLLIEQGPWLGGAMTAGGFSYLETNRNFPSGIYGEFRKRVVDVYKLRLGYDTTYNAPLAFEPAMGATILKKLTDTVKNLTVKLNTPFTDVKKDGTGWEVTIIDNKEKVTIKAKALIDATELGDVVSKINVLMTAGFDSRSDSKEALAPTNATNQIEDISYIATLRDYGRNTDHTIPKPEGYDASKYACLKGVDVKKLLNSAKLPNDKYMINWDNCASQYSVTSEDMQPENRAETFRKARLHTLGLIYYLQTELGFKNFGFADDFKTADHLPYIPYVRENRRAAGLVRMMLDDIYTPYDRGSQLYRTAIAVSDAVPGQHYSEAGVLHISYPPFPAFTIPLGAVVVKDQENLFVTEKALSVTHLVNGAVTDAAVQMSLGQGAGAAAAFRAFFQTTTKNLQPRIIQGEILDFKGYLMPFADIKQTDPAWRAIQQVGATGMLKGVQKIKGNRTEVLFMPDSTVTTAEIRPFLDEIYSRSFIWFNQEKPGQLFTVANTISFISNMNLRDPDDLRNALQKSWKSYYKFDTEFKADRPITRREFAVLANRFFNPFARKVDISGKVIN